MTKKVKRILGVIMGAAVMMAAAGCGQSADSGTKDAQEVKASEPNAENADSAQAESAEEVTGTIEMWSMLTQQGGPMNCRSWQILIWNRIREHRLTLRSCHGAGPWTKSYQLLWQETHRILW